MSLSESTGVCSTNKSTPTANTDDFFEGAEKTLHFWFSANDDEDVSVNAKNDDNTKSANNVNNTEFAENATGKRQIGVSEWVCMKGFWVSVRESSWKTFSIRCDHVSLMLYLLQQKIMKG